MGRVVWYITREMLLPALGAGVLFCCFLPLRRRRLGTIGLYSGPLRETGLLLYTMYLAGLFAATLVPFGFWAAVWSGTPPHVPAPFSGGVNWVPFQSLEMLSAWAAHGHWTDILVNLLGNVLIFLPAGFFPALLWRGATWRRALLCGLGCSLFIECLQLFVARSADVDDVMLNTIGALCGYSLLPPLQRLAPNLMEKLKCQTREAP